MPSAAGKIKGVNANKKEFVLTDSAGKDGTIKLGDNVVINRGGKESQSDLNAGDAVNVCYDKGGVNVDGALHSGPGGRHQKL